MKSSDQKNNQVSKVNCHQCVHYYITWDPSRPYGCRRMGFKTRRLPSIVVKQNSGMECQSFQPKTNKKK